MTTHFQFDLVSPEKTVMSKQAVMVTVPGGEGDFGVLPGHSPLITTVKPGVIDIYESDERTISDRFFVAGGFAEVTGERCTILAEEAVALIDLNRTKLDEELRNLMMDTSDAQSDIERTLLDEKLAIVRAKIEALQ
jgi:F-type H+-transporting ATPase subunit epsilon